MSSPIQNVGYGLTNALQILSPEPVVSKRNPTVRDLNYELGTVWVNKSTNAYWILTSVVAGSASWAAQSSTGSTTATSLELTAGSGTVLTLDGTGAANIGGALTVGGISNLNGAVNVGG